MTAASRLAGVVTPGHDVRAAARALGVPCGIERSVKLVPGRLLTGRFLIILPLVALGRMPRAGLARLAADLGAPQGVAAALTPWLGAATHLHLGSETEADGVERRKIYLEFAVPPMRERDLRFLAAKWRRGEAGVVLTRYERAGPPEALVAAHAGPSAGALRALLAAAGGPVAALLVHEREASRRSVDLNLYGAGLTLSELAAPVGALFRVFGHDPEPFLAQDGGRLLGHAAAGAGRDGAPFATLYFGAEAFVP